MQGNEQNRRLTRSKSRFLVGTTKPRNVSRWEKMVSNLMKEEVKRKERDQGSLLAVGEIRVELTTVKLSKNGLIRMGVLSPAAAAGDGIIVIKVNVPGDSEDVTETYPMRRGIAKVNPQFTKISTHEGPRSDELWDILHAADPELSDLSIGVFLCNKNGAELTGLDNNGNTVSKGEIGTAKLCLKDLVREEKPGEGGSVEIKGMIELSGIIGMPSAKEDKPKKKTKAKEGSKKDVTEEPEEEELEELEEPSPLGEIKVRIAVRPPTARGGSAPSAVAAVGASGGDVGGGDGASPGGEVAVAEEMPKDMLELARMALRRKSEFASLRRAVASTPVPAGGASSADDGAGVGVPGSGRGSSELADPAAASAPSPNLNPDADGDGDGGGGGGGSGAVAGLSAKLATSTSKKDSCVYTIAYWLKWRPFDAIGDQMLFFGEPRNQPALIRGSKLGALVDNQFCATEYDPRLAGDNWQLLIITNDGCYSKFYIGFSSDDDSGQPTPARAQEPDPSRSPADVRTEFDADVRIRRLNTVGKGAGLMAQSWFWPRDLEPDEVRELWMETKKRYPRARRGLPTGGLGKLAYREAPSIGKKGDAGRPQSAKKDDEKLPPVEGLKKKGGGDQVQKMPWEVYDPIIEKDTAVMLDVPLAAKLAFQKLLNVFAVLVDYTSYSASFLVVDRMHNMSNTPELMLEMALRRNPTSAPVVLLIDSRQRLQEATKKLKGLIDCGFLIDEEKAYGTNRKLLSHEFAMGSDLRRLVSKAGLAWLRASQSELRSVEAMMSPMCDKVRDIYIRHGDESSLNRDGRPKMQLIWTNFYQAQLYASSTHYIIFDEVEDKGRSLLSTLGSIGSIFLNGDTTTYTKIQACIEDGAPLLLLESTGGVTQAYAYVMKAVRLLKPKWDVDFVMRLITEYKARAQRDQNGKIQQEVNKKYMLENIHLLDKELARVDLMLADDTNDSWMANFGLPEILMIFEIWQRAPEFLLRQLQTADVMKKNAEQLLDLFTGCFSSAAGGIPELGLGNAEIKVVATAWNRHLLLYNNARIYSYRSWVMQFVLFYLGFMTTTLSIFTGNHESLNGIYELEQVMLIMPIVTALLETVNTRLRIQQKFSASKMASFMIVSEIYKFRVRSMDYDATSLSALLAEQKNPTKDKKKKDDNAIEVPISAKERDKYARQVFVMRVSEIYNNCMSTELSKGTSITHKSKFGMDPARLLRGDDTGPDDSQKETLEQLMEHVANRLYFMGVDEWKFGVDAMKARREAKSAKSNAAMRARIQGIAKNILMITLLIVINLVELSLKLSAMILTKLKGSVGGAGLGLPAGGKAAGSAGGDEEEGADGNLDDVKLNVSEKLRQLRNKYFNVDKAVGAIADVLGDSDDKKGERLDETHAEFDEDEAAARGGGDEAPAGGSKALGDDFFSSLTIDAYMQYRAKAVLSYMESTSPWRGFWMQLIEIIIFIMNAFGAVLVGMGTQYIPYVAMTVSLAAIFRSFLEFSRLGKQVEAYNIAVNMIHGMMNEWDRMTRTERRTRQTIGKVVGTVETALNIVASALTDALPGGGGDDDEGEGEEGEE